MPTTAKKTWWQIIDFSAVGVIAVLAVSVSGRYTTAPNLPWYAALTKPSFSPPDWVFAPVWGTLYLLMAFAIWRVLQLPPSPRRTTAIVLFSVQLALNAAWSWMFFAAHSPALGLVDIVPQLLAVVATFVVFLRIDRYAGWALAPLVVWVGFATALNAAVYVLNR